MASACALHILVKTEKQAKELKAQLDNGATFGARAKKHSLCPS
jgi:peptidyl-prolyl cis-trans isomerase C